jgi:hypothetical protein
VLRNKELIEEQDSEKMCDKLSSHNYTCNLVQNQELNSSNLPTLSIPPIAPTN